MHSPSRSQFIVPVLPWNYGMIELKLMYTYDHELMLMQGHHSHSHYRFNNCRYWSFKITVTFTARKGGAVGYSHWCRHKTHQEFTERSLCISQSNHWLWVKSFNFGSIWAKKLKALLNNSNPSAISENVPSGCEFLIDWLCIHCFKTISTDFGCFHSLGKLFEN